MLDKRKLKILYAIIDSYIYNAEPVGSRTITKQYDLGVSSATIRNEMSDLEDLGFLNKTHSSSGRVPSDKAYRIYVDKLMSTKSKGDVDDKDLIKKTLESQSKEINSILTGSSKLLSALTNYTTLVFVPSLSDSKLKYFNLSYIDEKEVLVNFVNDKGVIKNAIVKTDLPVSSENIRILSELLNNILKGANFSEIPFLIENAIGELQEYKLLIDQIIPIIKKGLSSSSESDLSYEGITKIFNYPEYKDIAKARSLLAFLEEKESIMDMLELSNQNSNIEIRIGEENIYDEIKDCSVITTSYFVDDRIVGKIGLIGPTRMDYNHLLSTLKYFYINVNNIINESFDDNKN